MIMVVVQLDDSALRCQLYVGQVSAPHYSIGKASAWYTSHLAWGFFALIYEHGVRQELPIQDELTDEKM